MADGRVTHREYMATYRKTPQNQAYMRAYRLKYREAHLVELTEKDRVYHSVNRERDRPKHKAWYEANKATILQWQRRYVEQHPDQKRESDRAYYLAHQQTIKARTKAWQAAHPEQVRAAGRVNQQRRRALQVRATIGDLKAVAAFFDWTHTVLRVRCYWHGGFVPRAKRHVDHIIPLARGGAHALGNLCVSCESCNRSKGARLPEAFSGQAQLRLA